MGELRLPGLATGIDTATLIKQMMAINSRRLASYQVKKNGYNSQTKALEELENAIESLKASAGTLSDAEKLDSFSATSSDSDILTISTSTGALPNSNSVEINQLATSETWIQDVSNFEHESDYVGAGTFMFSYNNQETTVTTVADTTLAEFVDKINLAKSGVTASLLYQGDKYHLMLSGQDTGEDYQISINRSSTRVWKSASALTLESDTSQNAGLATKITDLSQFDGGDLETGETITISGTVNGGSAIASLDIDITDETTIEHLIKKINTAFKGVAKASFDEGIIVLTDLTNGASSLSIDLTYNANGSAANLTLPAMAVSTEGGTAATLTAADAIFDIDSFVETQSAQNSQIKIDGYTPTPVAEVQTLTATTDPTSGTYTLTFEGQTTDAIDFDADATAIKAALANLSNIDLADDITVTGTLSGGEITVEFSDALGNVGMIAIDPAGLDAAANDVSNYAIAETTEGYYAQWIERNSNSITDAMEGITLNLKDVTEVDDPVGITVSRSTGSLIGKVQSLVGVYNTLLTELKTKTEYDSIQKKMGILSRDMAASFLKTQIQNPFRGIIKGFSDTEGDFSEMLDIGISFDGAGLMELDSEVFSEAVNENYSAVLELLGATKSGSGMGEAIEFYGASDKYTEAGTYDVKVTVSGGAITSAIIKKSTESDSEWRNATWSGNLITGDSTFDEEEGGPMYPENGLSITVDLSSDGNFTESVRVKQGVAGALEDMLEEILKSGGRIDQGKAIIDDRIASMTSRIEVEEKRLNKVETRLIAKYARLERILTMMQQQMGAISMISY